MTSVSGISALFSLLLFQTVYQDGSLESGAKPAVGVDQAVTAGEPVWEEYQ